VYRTRRLAQGKGTGPRRPSAEGGAGALIAETLTAGAVAILAASDPLAKAGGSQALATAWAKGTMPIGEVTPPPSGRTALLHALAHIELNAIDLAWDLVARFAALGLPREFFDDWVGVASEEARHFLLLSGRLAEFGARYGDLPAHDGLWETAAATAGDLLARLAVVPLVLEARGLDVTPEMAARLERAGDVQSAAILHVIYEQEIGHVAIGRRWFDRLCRAQDFVPAEVFRDRVRRFFKGVLKPPFNHQARAAAGFPAHYYEPLAGADEARAG
jgi:uncharacterized ferritin-like protein (DUF455 family)